MAKVKGMASKSQTRLSILFYSIAALQCPAPKSMGQEHNNHRFTSKCIWLKEVSKQQPDCAWLLHNFLLYIFFCYRQNIRLLLPE